jgi:hypothetical protein
MHLQRCIQYWQNQAYDVYNRLQRSEQSNARLRTKLQQEQQTSAQLRMDLQHEQYRNEQLFSRSRHDSMNISDLLKENEILGTKINLLDEGAQDLMLVVCLSFKQ